MSNIERRKLLAFYIRYLMLKHVSLKLGKDLFFSLEGAANFPNTSFRMLSL